jgi:hypothetical protein
MTHEKTVSIRLNVWANSRTRMIHLASRDAGLISTVSDDPGSKRFHPNLFLKLKRILVAADKWPEGL